MYSKVIVSARQRNPLFDFILEYTELDWLRAVEEQSAFGVHLARKILVKTIGEQAIDVLRDLGLIESYYLNNQDTCYSITFFGHFILRASENVARVVLTEDRDEYRRETWNAD